MDFKILCTPGAQKSKSGLSHKCENRKNLNNEITSVRNVFFFRSHRSGFVRDNDHHLHVRAPDHQEKGVHLLLVHALSVRGHVRADAVARAGPNNRAAEILEILHRARDHIHPGQGGEPEDQVHGPGHTGDGTAAVRRAEGEVLPSAELQIPVRPVGASELHRPEVHGIPFVHADLGAARELLVLSHQGARAVDVEIEKLLRPEQHQSGVPPTQGNGDDAFRSRTSRGPPTPRVRCITRQSSDVIVTTTKCG